MTTVIHIKDKDKYPGAIYIGRKGKKSNGYYGNPHPIGYCEKCSTTHDRDQCVAAFKADFLQRMINDSEYSRRIFALKNKVLMCFCFPLSCHGQVIADFIDKTDEDSI